jgi:hypothetical protein
MITCWRCGVDFDGTEYLPGAPCEDCQYDVEEPEIGWLRPNGWKRLKEREYRAKRKELVRYFYDQGYADTQIAEKLGMDKSTVKRVRTDELKLPVHDTIKLDEYDPFLQDSLNKQSKTGRRTGGDMIEAEREAHARWRLKYGWPEEAAYWAAKDAEEAINARV